MKNNFDQFENARMINDPSKNGASFILTGEIAA
jgi:hypothetical protein